MQLQWIDLIIIAVIALSALTGLFRGVVKEVVALGIWVAAIWLGYTHAHDLDPWLQTYINDPSVRKAAAFIIIVIGVLFVGGIINTILSFMLKRTGLSGMDKTLGMVFGFARGVFIVALVMAAVKMTSLPYQQYLQSSAFAARLDPLVNWISGYLPVFIDHVKSVDKTGNIIDTIPQS